MGPLWWMIPLRAKPNKLTNIAEERAAILKLALREYQADNGKPAETLDELVPKYLPSLPVDPFDYYGKNRSTIACRAAKRSNGRPTFRRRRNEVASPPPIRTNGPVGNNAARPPPAAKIKVPAGQGILWSVGEDRIDDGGHRQTGGYAGYPPG